MKTGNIEKVIRTTYLLEMGVDFQVSDLEDDVLTGHYNKRLSKDFTANFSKLNIGKLVWSGFFDKYEKTVMVKTEKELFV